MLAEGAGATPVVAALSGKAGRGKIVCVVSGGNLDLALGLAQKAKELLPDSPSTSDTLAWVQYKKGLHEAALPLLKECVRKAPDKPIYHYHLGMALLAAGEGREAKTHLETALRLKLGTAEAGEARTALAQLR